MTPRREFHPLQAVEIAKAFAEAGVEYLFIGKGGAILLGFPGTTQDVDVYADKTPENCERIIEALRAAGFVIDDTLAREILEGKDFVQIKTGPFDVDLVFAPDGIESFSAARARSVRLDPFRIANLRDIIASKRASNRQKDLLDLRLLDAFREEYEKGRTSPLKSSADIAAERAREPRDRP
ncbi:MAG: hypothetical protein JXP34_26905 [Planctomycetes bacterium]|nr:hypothetical protein [Planctomycetota bacterium]